MRKRRAFSARRSTWLLDLITVLEPSDKLKSANLLMGIGLVPVGLWALYLAGLIASCGQLMCDLTSAGLVALFGGLAYCVMLGFGGFGILSAGRQLRANPDIRAPITRFLQFTIGAVAGAPWIWLVVSVAKGGK